MKLNTKCFNAVLIYLEKEITVSNTGLVNTVKINSIVKNLSNQFSCEDIYYSVRKLTEAQFIDADTVFKESSSVNDITYLGHQYLKDI